MIAGMEFIQDFVTSLVNENQFQLFESLFYKLFWLLFIPFSIAATAGLKKISTAFSGPGYWLGNSLLVAGITLVHLFVFSIFLFGLSSLLHENPWSLSFLLAEKLSTRLYIGLGFYILLSAIYFLLNRQPIPERSAPAEPSDATSNTITVKNGKKSVIVQAEDIKWISSDGPYLFIHTTGKKHIITDRLKNLIEILPSNFSRIHRSTIVNVNMISELRSRGNGDYDVVLSEGSILRLSRNYAKPVKEMLL